MNDNRVAFIVESTPEYAFNAIRRYVSAMNVGVQQLIYHTQHYNRQHFRGHVFHGYFFHGYFFHDRCFHDWIVHDSL